MLLLQLVLERQGREDLDCGAGVDVGLGVNVGVGFDVNGKKIGIPTQSCEKSHTCVCLWLGNYAYQRARITIMMLSFVGNSS